jgi:hypothetical protein
MNTENSSSDLPLTDSMDQAILMHRDAHFSGSFDLMLNYYKMQGKGVNLDFDIDKIIALSELERELGQNLSALVLSGPDAEKVAKAKTAYKDLRKLYENPTKDKKYALLIADLILSEDEDPVKELDAIVAEKSAVVRSLIQLLRAEDFHDPLMPGYGKAPLLAATALGLIGDKSAIISLFETLGNGDFFDEDTELAALKAIGEPAKEFLLNVVKSKPLNADNEKAAIGLIQFKDDLKVAETCFKMLQEKEVLKNLTLSTYLILACEHINETPYKDAFINLANDKTLDKMLRLDILSLSKEWKSTS